jgi:hypothetical protein
MRFDGKQGSCFLFLLTNLLMFFRENQVDMIHVYQTTRRCISTERMCKKRYMPILQKLDITGHIAGSPDSQVIN